MNTRARKNVLPQFFVSELTDELDDAANRVNIGNGFYFTRPKMVPIEVLQRDGIPNWAPLQFDLYPVILYSDGSPLPEANMWILSCVEDKVMPEMASFMSIADDLTAYLKFVEEVHIDWLNFPSQKLLRPTYRFNGHLRHLVFVCAPN